MWIITKDRVRDKDDPNDKSQVGTEGPDSSPGWKSLTKEQKKQAEKWRMLDGDGEVYYEGLYLERERYPGEMSGPFEPLDDFGIGYAGCSCIEYKNKAGEWEVL